MASRGRGIRAKRVEAPRPRKSTGQLPNSTDAPAAPPSSGVERMLVDKLLGRLEDGALTPSEASSLNLTLKNCGEALQRHDHAYMSRVLGVLRSCLKTTPLSQTSRLYLLEVLELAARGWAPHPAVDRYYDTKYRELNVKQRITRELGGEKAIERASLPLRSISYDPSAFINAETPPPKFSRAGKTSPQQAPPGGATIQRLSAAPYENGKGVIGYDISIPEKCVGMVMGKGGERVVAIQKLSDTRITTNKASIHGTDDRKMTITGPGENSIKKAVAIIEHLLETGTICDKPAPRTSLSRGLSTSSLSSDPATPYETASEGDPRSPANDCADPLNSDFLETRQSSLLSSSINRSTSSTGSLGHTRTPVRRSLSLNESRHTSSGSSGSANVFVNGLDHGDHKAAHETSSKDIKMVYSIPVGEHVLHLQCTSEDILKEAFHVLSRHFLGSSSSKALHKSANKTSSSVDLDDPNNNTTTVTSVTPGDLTSDLPPLPDDDDDLWTDNDDVCLDTEISRRSDVSTSTAVTRQVTSTPMPPMDTVTAAPTPSMLARPMASVLEVSEIQARTPDNVLNKGFVGAGMDAARDATVCSEEPSLDLEGLVRRELEGSTLPLDNHTYNGSLLPHSRSSLSDSKGSSVLPQKATDSFGCIQPVNIMRLPLNPLATDIEIKRVESSQASDATLGMGLGPAARRRFFHQTSMQYYRKKHQTEVRAKSIKRRVVGQKVLQYGQSFLLACARSPLSRQPPPSWALEPDLPDVCLSKDLGFEPSLVDWTMQCVPVAAKY